MRAETGNSALYLEAGEAVEVVLPGGRSVWVHADGHVQQPPRRKRKPVSGPDPYDPTTDDGTVAHDGLTWPSYGE